MERISTTTRDLNAGCGNLYLYVSELDFKVLYSLNKIDFPLHLGLFLYKSMVLGDLFSC